MLEWERIAKFVNHSMRRGGKDANWYTAETAKTDYETHEDMKSEAYLENVNMQSSTSDDGHGTRWAYDIDQWIMEEEYEHGLPDLDHPATRPKTYKGRYEAAL